MSLKLTRTLMLSYYLYPLSRKLSLKCRSLCQSHGFLLGWYAYSAWLHLKQMEKWRLWVTILPTIDWFCASAFSSFLDEGATILSTQTTEWTLYKLVKLEMISYLKSFTSVEPQHGIIMWCCLLLSISWVLEFHFPTYEEGLLVIFWLWWFTACTKRLNDQMEVVDVCLDLLYVSLSCLKFWIVVQKMKSWQLCIFKIIMSTTALP